MIAVYVDLTDQYLGELIEEVIEKYYPELMEIVDFDEILEYITVKIINGDKRYDDYDAYKKLLRKLSRNKQIAKTLISYLISKYIDENLAFDEEFNRDDKTPI